MVRSPEEKRVKNSLDIGMNDLQDRLAFLENRLKMLDTFEYSTSSR
jgi:hypothetical protein